MPPVKEYHISLSTASHKHIFLSMFFLPVFSFPPSIPYMFVSTCIPYVRHDMKINSTRSYHKDALKNACFTSPSQRQILFSCKGVL